VQIFFIFGFKTERSKVHVAATAAALAATADFSDLSPSQCHL
jgi:hypothetical protein